MRIVDPHFHIWDLDHLSYPWLTTQPSTGVFGDNGPIRRTYLMDSYLAGTQDFQIEKTVHVEAAVGPRLAVDETVWLDTIADDAGQPNAIVAYCDLSGADVEAELEAQQQSGRLRGIRQILNTHHDPMLNFASEEYMENPRWLEGFESLDARGLSFDLQIYPHQMKAAAALAARFPDTSIILNHAGMPLGNDNPAFEAWRGGMAELARCQNVSVKISGLGMMFHNWTEPIIRPFVEETITLFGPERCMFASNFPVDSMYSTFDVLWFAYSNIVSDMSSADQDLLLAATAERIYRI